MKRILIFIGLKVGEILCGVIFVGLIWGGVALGTFLIINEKVILGLICFLPACAFLICLLWENIQNWIRWNWKKAGELAERK